MSVLRDFQREDVNFLKSCGMRCLIANSPGTGKTIITLQALMETYEDSMPAIVVCPASVTRNWAKEAKMWAPGVKAVVIEDGSTKIPKKYGKNTIYIISWALLDARWEDFVRIGVKTLIADEAHFAKEQTALRSVALAQLASHTKCILLLTGTPIINSTAELDSLKALFGTVEPPMIRRLLEDVAPDIPEKFRAYVYVKLREDDQQYYDNAMADFENWLRNEKRQLQSDGLSEAEIQRILVAEALTKIGYLKRIVGEAKTYAAIEWIARAVRIGEPVVVFMEHQAVLKKIERGLKRMKVLYRVIEGSTSSIDRHEAITDFQNNEFPVILCTKAGKEGITLTAARHLLFVERFYTSAEEEQAEDRIRRIGQRFETHIWFLHAVGTIDDRLDTIVRSKRQIIRAAIGSSTTAETSTGNVEAMLSSWAQHAAPKVAVAPLGHGKPLPPLPKARETHAIIFSGDRWNPKTAAVWCKMNGYDIKKVGFEMTKLKVLMNPVEYFKKGTFSSFRVCADIKLLTGKRVGHAHQIRFDSARKAMM